MTLADYVIEYLTKSLVAILVIGFIISTCKAVLILAEVMGGHEF